MSDFISRAAAIETIKKERDYIGKFSYEEERAFVVGFQQGITFALSDIASIPAADTIGEVEGSKHGWISVKERLPEEYTMVFTYDNYGAILAGMRIRTEKGGEWLREGRNGSVVSHWLPFPPDPNGKTIWG